MLKILFMTLLIDPSGIMIPTDQDVIGLVTKENIEICNAKRRQREFTYFPEPGYMAVHICLTVTSDG